MYIIEYILPYSFLISIGAFCVGLTCKAFFGLNKVVKGFLIFSATTYLLNISTCHFYIMTSPHRSPYSHYNCTNKIEAEANNIASALSDYFAIPSRTQVPNYDDLIKFGHFTSDYPFKDRDSKHTKKLMKESEFSVEILGDDPYYEIKIVLYSKVNKCPFTKGRCPRPYKGRFYVKKLSMKNDEGGWTNSF